MHDPSRIAIAFLIGIQPRRRARKRMHIDSPSIPSRACHVVHLIYRLGTGGVENVVVQLVNRLPRASFRHTVIALTDVDYAFAGRVENVEVELIALDKPPGQPFPLYPKLYRLLRRLRADVLHSCNVAALEFMPMATLARIPRRIHVEHGMDIAELRGKEARYRLLRKMYRPFVTDYVAVSIDQFRRFEQIGIAHDRVHLIRNGVDTDTFRPRRPHDVLPAGFPFSPGRDWIVGTVGRLVDIKNPLLLVDAFTAIVATLQPGTERLRLAIVGEGPLLPQIAQRMRDAGLDDRLWLPGVRTDVPEILRAFDCFALTSLSEATSCALQEAMATGLPIVATDVGGNADLLEHGECGSLTPSGDVHALAAAILRQCEIGLRNPMAEAARSAVQQRFGLNSTIERYRQLFLGLPGRPL